MIFVPKVIHPWYEVVKAASMFAAEEYKKQGITVDVIWDRPPQADAADQNTRIETDIGRHPDGLVVSCLDPATNDQVLDEAVGAGVNVSTFNSFCAERFPFVGQNDSYQDGYDLAEFLAKQIGDEGNGGTNLRGGDGTVVGTVLGAVLLTVLQNGTVLLNVSGYWQRVIIGSVVLVAVLVDLFRRK